MTWDDYSNSQDKWREPEMANKKVKLTNSKAYAYTVFSLFLTDIVI